MAVQKIKHFKLWLWYGRPALPLNHIVTGEDATLTHSSKMQGFISTVQGMDKELWVTKILA